MKNNTIKYIFENKQPELRRLIIKYGLTPAKNNADLWKKVNYLIAKFKDEMLFDVAKLHPDKDLILWAYQQQQQQQQQQQRGFDMMQKSSYNQNQSNVEGDYSDACGCSSANGDEYSNACGCSSANGDDYSNCNGNPDCKCNCSSGVDGQESKTTVADKLKNNMPLVVVGSLLLVGSLILFGNRAV